MSNIADTRPRPSPTAPFAVHHPAFADVLGDAPRLEPVAIVDAHEGPVYAADEDALYVTTTPRPGRDGWGAPEVAIGRIALDGDRFPVAPGAVSTLRPRANAANGMALDAAGRLVVCEQGSLRTPARISLVDRATGLARTLVDAWEGLPLNSPNDVIVAPDGAVWFTDPSYGHVQGFRPRPRLRDRVYRLDPVSGRPAVVADGLDKPNGLALSPDGRALYVADSGANQEPGSFHPERPHQIVAVDLDRPVGPGALRVLAVTRPGVPDGLAVDARGRVYASAASGVQVFSPEGDPLGEIRLPGAVNLTFGGPGRNVLFITADTAVWAAVLAAAGPPPPGRPGQPEPRE